MKDRNYKSRRIILTVLIITVISAIGLYINNTLTSSNLKKNGIIMSAEIIEITVNNEKIEGSGLGLQPNYNKYIKLYNSPENGEADIYWMKADLIMKLKPGNF